MISETLISCDFSRTCIYFFLFEQEQLYFANYVPHHHHHLNEGLSLLNLRKFSIGQSAEILQQEKHAINARPKFFIYFVSSSLVARNLPLKVNNFRILGFDPDPCILQYSYQLSYARKDYTSQISVTMLCDPFINFPSITEQDSFEFPPLLYRPLSNL